MAGRRAVRRLATHLALGGPHPRVGAERVEVGPCEVEGAALRNEQQGDGGRQGEAAGEGLKDAGRGRGDGKGRKRGGEGGREVERRSGECSVG